jgi:hypothetical protein
VTFGGIGKTRRWQLAIAIVAALSLFTAVTTGWALRGSALAQIAGPLPAAWQVTHVGVNVAHSQPDAQPGDPSQPASYLTHGTSPTHQKPTKHAWMARERPQTWTRLSAQSDWSALPASFAPRGPAFGVQPGGTHSAAPAAAPTDRDLLTQLCVDRR